MGGSSLRRRGSVSAMSAMSAMSAVRVVAVMAVVSVVAVVAFGSASHAGACAGSTGTRSWSAPPASCATLEATLVRPDVAPTSSGETFGDNAADVTAGGGAIPVDGVPGPADRPV